MRYKRHCHRSVTVVHLLNLLAAIALLVWGTHIVRTGMLRVFGENLRRVLAESFSNRFTALLAGLGVTSLVQSSTATCLIVASFVGSGIVGEWGKATWFTSNCYTALGQPLAVAHAWRLVPSMIAASGIFTFAWTASVLVNFVARYNALRAGIIARQGAGLS